MQYAAPGLFNSGRSASVATAAIAVVHQRHQADPSARVATMPSVIAT